MNTVKEHSGSLQFRVGNSLTRGLPKDSLSMDKLIRLTKIQLRIYAVFMM
jgi:hypothetical protein